MNIAERDELLSKINAADLGCAICTAKLKRIPPVGDPFSSGPHQGRYWCEDCWTWYYDEHPEYLADIETQQYIAKKAKRILLKRTH